MAADAAVTSPPPAPVGRGPVSRRRVDVLTSRASAVFGVLFGLQTVPIMFSQIWEAAPVWSVVFVPAMYAALLAALAAAVVQRAVRRTQGAVAIVYLVGVVTWPLAMAGADVEQHPTTWLYYLLTVATAMAAIAFRPTLASAYLLVLPAVLAIIRLAIGEAPFEKALFDSVYALLLGGAVVIIITMLREAATSVDDVQAVALQEYGIAVRQQATEAERVQVDSIVHDSVLTTLLSAARAETPETRALAAGMARSAIGHLRQAALASPGDGAAVAVSLLASRVAQSAYGQGAPFEVRVQVDGAATMTATAAEAVYSAAVQAMVNSVQHAGDERVRRWAVVRTRASGAIEIEIGDDGCGFDPGRLAGGRMGLRVSMVERVASAGGLTHVHAEPGAGTRITVLWPQEEGA